MATITVLGQAEVSVPPDLAKLTLSVESVAEAPEAALGAVGERARALIGLMNELGIPPADRVTSGISVAEEGQHDERGQWQHRGYRATERLTVSVTEEHLGRLIGEAVSRTQARIEGPWWVVAPDNPVRHEALRAAAANARQRADAVAEGLGVRVGAVSEAVEGGPAHRPYASSRVASFAPLAVDPPIEAGSTTITSTVSVTFQVESA